MSRKKKKNIKPRRKPVGNRLGDVIADQADAISREAAVLGRRKELGDDELADRLTKGDGHVSIALSSDGTSHFMEDGKPVDNPFPVSTKLLLQWTRKIRQVWTRCNRGMPDSVAFLFDLRNDIIRQLAVSLMPDMVARDDTVVIGIHSAQEAANLYIKLGGSAHDLKPFNETQFTTVVVSGIEGAIAFTVPVYEIITDGSNKHGEIDPTLSTEVLYEQGDMKK